MLWKALPTPETSAVQELSNLLNVPEVVAILLVQRGITTFDQAKAYFRPDWDALHDPFLMHDMLKAVQRIQKAINGQEAVMVFETEHPIPPRGIKAIRELPWVEWVCQIDKVSR